ncbi:MAG: phage integrase N-terminal SAM-like domain-containing protein [Spirochaetes bacterium]|nr:phage integrase N-terminal SAM-like domain-containing protein [Spirochaetota bacterium]
MSPGRCSRSLLRGSGVHSSWRFYEYFKFTKTENKDSALKILSAELSARKYSKKTIDIYLFYNTGLLEHASKSPENIGQSDIINYLHFLNEEKKSSASTLNLSINNKGAKIVVIGTGNPVLKFSYLRYPGF